MKMNIQIPALPATQGYALHLRKLQPDPVSIALQKHLRLDRAIAGIEFSTLVRNGRQIQLPTPDHAQAYLVNYYMGRSVDAMDFELIVPGFFFKYRS